MAKCTPSHSWQSEICKSRINGPLKYQRWVKWFASASREDKRAGTLWCAVGFHLGYDWSQAFFYRVPNSGFTPSHNLFNVTLNRSQWLTGGTVGPEASVICPLVLAVMAILFSLRHREARYRA